MASNPIRQWLTIAIASGLVAGLGAQQASQSSADASRSQMRPVTATGTDPVASTDLGRGTVISPRDKITVKTVNFCPQWCVEAIVDIDGSFDFGSLGRIKAAGLTPRQLETELKSKLNPDWVINPQVTVDLIPTQSKRVMVSGAVRNPSEIPFSGKMTVFQALVAVGSTADNAGDRAFIIRGNPDGSMPSADQVSDAPKTYVDLNKVKAGDIAENYTLNDGDYLYVEQAQPFTINGEIKSPGQYPARDGLTVQQAIAIAGGFTDKASKGGVKILRPTTDPKNPVQTIKVDNEKLLQTMKVKAGDTIMVPARIM